MAEWFEEPSNAAHLARLRNVVGEGRLLVFLGAGLSFGAARFTGRARFDSGKYDYRKFGPPDDIDVCPDDDGLPMPSWPWLVGRMRREVIIRGPEQERHAVRRFFIEEGPLDCAQLFRQTVGEANYRDFLLDQFDMGRHPFIATTPSHDALVRLALPLIFTTNYDELIESAYLQSNVQLRVSINEEQFRAQRSHVPHLMKLHGSINQPDTVVLTRSDYARSRHERKEMFAFLRNELVETAFLFVGFSLSDPNFGLLHDDVRLVYGMNMPPSYAVQGPHDPVKDRYLTSLDVNSVWLHDWNHMPDFLNRIRADHANEEEM